VILQDITVRKKVEQALQRQNNRLATMNAINHAILNAQSSEEIAQATLINIQDLVPYQQAHVLINLPESKELLVLAAADDGNSHFLKSGNKLADAAFANRENRELNKFFVAEKLGQISNPNPLERLLLKQNIQTYVNAPLLAEENFIGVFQLATLESTTFQPSQIEILREIAETLTVAIHQSQLNQKLKRTNEELRGLLRAKHEMLENVSHELRSPLALIKGYTELLKEGLLGPLTDKQLDALHILDSKGDQLFFLVSRLFTLQTVNKHTLQKVPLNPSALLNETVQSWQVLMNNNNVQLKLDTPSELPVLMADSNLLNQVLTNLLDNALKYSPVGSTITIHALEKDHKLIISIEDQGPGIPTDKIDQIFERFYQVEKGTTKAKPGAGIGLALCTAIVDAHEGRLWAESDGDGQGSTFIVSLPLAGCRKNNF
jgi:signal transduction histidine kinase